MSAKFHFPGMEDQHVLFDGMDTLLVRGKIPGYAASVLLRLPVPNGRPASGNDRLDHEFRLFRGLEIQGIPHLLGQERIGGYPALVYEDPGGMTLLQYMDRFKEDLLLFFNLALDLVNLMGRLHKHGVFHGEIHPGNILVIPENSGFKVCLTGGGTAPGISAGHMRSIGFDPATSLLTTISPELTGRMNRVPDYRTDFYSLGAVFYQVLTGEPPFAAQDLLEMVYAHLALTPAPPRKKNPIIPEPVSQLVMKLLSKEPDARYVSSAGLAADLAQCRNEYLEKGGVEKFCLGRKDFSANFKISENVYGREKETRSLLDAFERIIFGPVELVSVSGYSGIGKTTLINRLRKPVFEENGVFVTGKCNPSRQAEPCAPFVEAFTDWTRQILAEPDSVITRFKEHLTAAVGREIPFLAEVIPGIGHIIGKQPTLPSYPPDESNNRFFHLLTRFVSVASGMGRPVVMFLDDLQWGDIPTYRMLESLAVNPQLTGILLIISFRDNEVDESHDLTQTLDRISKQNKRIHRLCLGPMTPDDLNRVISDTLFASPGETKSLSRLCAHKTGGNPFFLRQFFFNLADRNFIFFDDKKQKWQWDMDQIQSEKITDNAAELTSCNIHRMDTQVREVLKYAACIGNRFGIDLLSGCMGGAVQDILTGLGRAVDAGLLHPLPDHRATAPPRNPDGEVSPQTVSGEFFCFPHDRIFEAAGQLADPGERTGIHLEIGRYILKSCRAQDDPAARIEENIFDIVSQLNRARQGSTHSFQRRELVELNLLAGNKAKRMALFESAFQYFRLARELTGQNGWQRRYELTRDIHLGGIESAFVTGRFKEVDEWYEAILGHVVTPLEMVDACAVMIQKETVAARFHEAVSTALLILSKLGFEIPARPTKAEFGTALDTAETLLSGRSVAELIRLPVMDDPVYPSVLKIMALTLTSGYVFHKRLNPLITCVGISLLIRRGNCRYSSIFYGTFAWIMGTTVGNLDKGYALGRLSMDLLDRFEDSAFESRTIYLFYTFVSNFKEHMGWSIKPLAAVYRRCMEIGNTLYAGLSIVMVDMYRYLKGENLNTLEKQMAANRRVLTKNRSIVAGIPHDILHQAVLNLMGKSRHKRRLIGEVCNEDKILSLAEKQGTQAVVESVIVTGVPLAYLFEDYKRAVDMAARLSSKTLLLSPLPAAAKFYFFTALAYLARIREEGESTRYCDRAAYYENKLTPLVNACPENYLHMIRLIRAEQARVKGQTLEAQTCYIEAIEAAKAGGFIQDEALAHELAARFWLALDNSIYGRFHMDAALERYAHWGAMAKVAQVQQQYKAMAVSLKEPDAAAPASGDQSLNSLDMMSVMRASQAISGEILLERLLERMMSVVVENAGAESGWLLLEHEGTLYSAARTGTDFPDSIAHKDINHLTQINPLHLPLQLVQYVMRTRESLVMEDAAGSDRFISDPYINEKQPRSILCAPILYKERLLGLFYLENNLITGAFCSQRLKMIDILSSQVAISLENARLYDSQRKAEAALLLEKERLAVTLDSIGDSVVSTNEEGTILFINPAAETLAGWSRQEAVGQPFSRLFPMTGEESGDACPDPAAAILDSGGPTPGNVPKRLTAKDRSHRVVVDTGTPIRDRKGKTVGAVMVFRDVTEQRELEKKVQMSQKMEAIGMLASGIAHDFNNILTGILGYTELARVKSEKAPKYLDRVTIAGKRAADLVNQILSFSRLKEFNRQPVCLSPLIKESIKLLRASLPASIEIKFKNRAENDWIKGDASQIHQVVMNLGTNAAYAMKGKNGRLTIGIDMVSVTPTARIHPVLSSGPHIRLTVSDTGHGIPSSIVENIFDPFFTTKSVGEGTGLGLWVIHGIVKEHEGVITVYSEEGRGTAFHIYLPAISESCGEENRDEPGEALTGRGTILFVDDDEMIRELGLDILESLGYEVEPATDGLDGLEHFRQSPSRFDLVITDTTMPRMSGPEMALAMLKEGHDCPVILTSGKPDHEPGSSLANIRDFLLKPYSMEEMAQCVRKVLKRKTEDMGKQDAPASGENP